jgi:putative glutamine amidotransferase
MRPRIGITSWHRSDADQLERWEAIRSTYTGAVRLAGGLPLVLPIADDDPALIGDYLAAVDGLLFTGGEDVAPAYYGEPRDERCQEPDPERDLFEIQLARTALSGRVPLLGICRGLQVLNVATGGTLHQHLPDVVGHTAHSPAPGVFGRVPVRLSPELAKIYDSEDLTPAHYHHQAIDRLGDGLEVTARSEDGTIEAVELASHPFALAVQWHPEADEDGPLFHALVEHARRTPAS